VRALASVAAFALICALGAGGAAAGGNSEAASSFVNRLCPTCNPPERYHFHIWGTTGYRYGGTETWSMKGRLYRHRRHVSALKADYWQATGTVTLTFRNIGVDYYSGCGGDGRGVINAPTQTLKLRRDDWDVGFTFRMNEHPSYEVSTGHSTDDNRGVHGTLRCSDGSTQPVYPLQHRWTGFVTRRGKPRGVVKGKFEYTDIDLYHYRAHWKLTAIR
jgi:hypothetical protein